MPAGLRDGAKTRSDLRKRAPGGYRRLTEGKEHLGGFTIVEADDLDEALGWARKLAVILEPLSVEVRPFAG